MGPERRSRDQGRCTVRRQGLAEPPVEQAWRRLQAEGAVSSPFLTWQWCSGVLSEPSTAARTRVCVVERGGEVVGLFPVEAAVVDGWRTIGPAGWQWLAPDHLDVVASPRDRAAVAAAIVRDLLSRSGVDVIDLDGLARDGELARAASMSRLSAARRGAVRLPTELIPCEKVALTGTPVLRSASLRSQVGRGLRSVQRDGGGFEVVSEPEAAERLLDELMELHRDRFGEASAVFATEARRQAHRRALRQLTTDGLARIYRLHLGGVSIALLYALRHGSTLSYYSAGMRSAAALSPGRTLLGLVVLSAAEEGMVELDLLRGEHEYKSRYSTGVQNDERVRLVRATPAVARGGLSRVATGLVERLRR